MINDHPYKLLELLGKGSFGTVYSIQHKRFGERFALKLITVQDDKFDEKSILHEIAILREVSHINIVKAYDYSIIKDENNMAYIKLPDTLEVSNNCKILAIRFELCDCDLETKLNDREQIDEEFNKNIFLQIVKGVKYLQRLDICHRDLKPANILLKNGVVKIADFGLGKLNIFSYDKSHTGLGTPIYRAPEILTGKYNKSVDIYSLGIILIKLFTNQSTFKNWCRTTDFYTSKFDKIIPDNLENDYIHVSGLIDEMIGPPNYRPSIKILDKRFLNIMLKSMLINLEPSSIYSNGKVLCLDGGGIRGLIEIQILEYFEEQSGRKTKDNFEWIVGKGAGGLIALFLCLGHSSTDCIQYFQLLKRIIFESSEFKEIEKSLRSGQYSQTFDESLIVLSNKYDHQLKAWFGTKMMSDIKNIKVIITAAANDNHTKDLVHYSNFDPATKYMQIWQVARETNSATTYFRNSSNKPYGPLVDSGLNDNNPTKTALTQIKKFHQIYLKKEMFLNTCVSIGTGIMTERQISLLNIGNSGFYNFLEMLGVAFINIHLKLINALNSIILSSNETLESGETFCVTNNIKFYRFNPKLSRVIKINETNNSKLRDMRYETNEFIRINQEQFEECLNSMNQIF